MIFGQLAAVLLAAALLSAGLALVRAQETAAPRTDSSGQNAAGPPRANTGLPESDGIAGSAGDGTGRDQGTITRAGKDKPGRVGKDGALPKPNVRDDIQHRCLSPSGIC